MIFFTIWFYLSFESSVCKIIDSRFGCMTCKGKWHRKNRKSLNRKNNIIASALSISISQNSELMEILDYKDHIETRLWI